LLTIPRSASRKKQKQHNSILVILSTVLAITASQSAKIANFTHPNLKSLCTILTLLKSADRKLPCCHRKALSSIFFTDI